MYLISLINLECAGWPHTPYDVQHESIPGASRGCVTSRASLCSYSEPPLRVMRNSSHRNVFFVAGVGDKNNGAEESGRDSTVAIKRFKELGEMEDEQTRRYIRLTQVRDTGFVCTDCFTYGERR